MTNEQVIQKVIQARFGLLQKFKFFGRLLQNLNIVVTKEVPTMAVSENDRLFVNPDFVKEQSTAAMKWLLAHEAMHIVTDSFGRFPKGAFHMLWNIASDISINMIITDVAGVPLPTLSMGGKPIQAYYGEEYQKYKDKTTEAIYRDLLKDVKEKICPSCGEGYQVWDPNSASGKGQESKGKGDKDQEGEGQGGEGQGGEGQGGEGQGGEGQGGEGQGGEGQGSKLTMEGDSVSCSSCDGRWVSPTPTNLQKEKPHKWERRIRHAASSAKQAGNMPGELEEFVNSLLDPQKDWRRQLMPYMSRWIKARFTWKRPSRRTAGGVRTPARDKRKIAEAIVYLDTSGSMGDRELRRALSEVNAIIQTCGGKGRLLLGDTEIYYDGEIDEDAIKRLPIQRGGTDFRPIFAHIEKADYDDPTVLVGFTDCYGPFPETPPNFPVIWCQVGQSATPPWGDVISVDIESLAGDE